MPLLPAIEIVSSIPGLAKDSKDSRRREWERCTRRFTTYGGSRDEAAGHQERRRAKATIGSNRQGLKRPARSDPSINTRKRGLTGRSNDSERAKKRSPLGHRRGLAASCTPRSGGLCTLCVGLSFLQRYQRVHGRVGGIDQRAQKRSCRRAPQAKKGIAALAEPRWSEFDKKCLRLACRLARSAAGRTSPNPLVGAECSARRRRLSLTVSQTCRRRSHAEKSTR